ncbi:MAG: metalloregulator ArsR/SmtB family transcription factor [Ancalomicrobiaceae bacterium]|nr:metalloregulator ArsR/SmtB family transcription factor [Ancalomicrobiaceae bacterium]
MESKDALEAFAALSQSTRLDAFRLLIRHEPDGLSAGEIAARVGVPQNTLSTHLAILTRARLTSSERRSRSIIYRANIATVRELVGFLADDCCAGHPEQCLVLEPLPCGCEPKTNNPA